MFFFKCPNTIYTIYGTFQKYPSFYLRSIWLWPFFWEAIFPFQIFYETLIKIYIILTPIQTPLLLTTKAKPIIVIIHALKLIITDISIETCMFKNYYRNKLHYNIIFFMYNRYITYILWVRNWMPPLSLQGRFQIHGFFFGGEGQNSQKMSMI